ncbi:MAG: hypothetical protein JJ866_18120 [Roseibium sp.]|uniref:hypothetical protein n=1 Tax=Roseibium sp. TaxID=1936156 RepID=UPI001B17D352|nr:hypothetical protein [Roseibium sp.]MBO6509391.1 hypothetical protein [Roseibium sp.]MBO6893861.1 hypothetical protein [Roseibium sp.]MBO6932626.1 hypothetical protein [Roseibium sp.]
MASGGHVDRIAAEFGVHFVASTKRADGRHQSKARRTCAALLKNHGAAHLRLVLGLINTEKNRGNWSAPVITAVSWLVLNKPQWVARRDFLEVFDSLDLAQFLLKARDINPSAPTVTLSVLLSYEFDQLIKSQLRGKAA